MNGKSKQAPQIHAFLYDIEKEQTKPVRKQRERRALPAALGFVKEMV
jgi:hypothetical protein